MQQHPIPQNVTSYQFRLIGDMTLKQFLQLLAGGVAAYIFFSTNLINIVKYFFMFISVLLGVAFAFLPLEGRPLEQWLMAFLRAIYLPTQFYWEKKPKLPDYLLDTSPLASPPITNPTPHNPPPEPLKKEEPLISQFEETHSKRIEEIISLYKDVPLMTSSSKPTTTTAPSHSASPANSAPASISVTPIESIVINNADQATDSLHNLESKIQNQTSYKPQPLPTNPTNPNPPPTIAPTPGSFATFNPTLPFPSLPETPNTLVGMVFDQTGNIIDNAVIEINNTLGTVRATKTNRLGQFFLATPLNDDVYSIAIEKDGLTFKPISLKLENKIYPPLEIRAIN